MDTYNLIYRVAQLDELDEKKIQKADLLIPRTVMQKFRRAFTPKGLPFFQFYIELKRINLGAPVPDAIRMMYRRAVNRLIQVTSPVDKRSLSPAVVNLIADSRPEMNMLLGRLEKGMDNPQTWKRINNLYVPIILATAKDKGIYLRTIQRGMEQWAVFRKMTAKQEYVEQLKDDDPEGYQLMQQYGQTLEQIDDGIHAKIERLGLEATKGFLAGTPVILGVDPKTGEERVYDRDGEVLTKEDFIIKRRERAEAERRLAKIPDKTRVPLDQLRTVPDEIIDELPGNVEMAALTDDKAKQGRLTKILPVKWHDYVYQNADGEWVADRQQVIVNGRYKGVYLDDMVNGMGRLIEGTAYKYSPMAGRGSKVPQRIDPSEQEPYVSVAETVEKKRKKDKATGKYRTIKTKRNRLYLKINGTSAQKELRNAIKKLACNAPPIRGCIPSVMYVPVEGSRAAGFYFEPKDFSVIMDSLQGMSLSKAALQTIKDYYKDLANAEQATVKENLGNYSARALGGFVESKKDPVTGEMKQFDLLSKQKQALAWLDANGNRGVCALDTGVGKCVREDTLICTNRGLIPIRDMNPNLTKPDTTAPVVGFDVAVGDKRFPVQNFYFGGPRPTIRVTTRRGYEIEGSRIHPLLARTPDGRESWVQTPDLKSGDFLCIDRTMGVFGKEDPELSVPVQEDFQQASRNSEKTSPKNVRVFPVPDKMSPDMGRLLGYIVAEGYTNQRKFFTISQCPEKNPTVRADIECLLREQLGWEAKPDKDIVIASVFLREYLSRMGIGMGVAKNKTVPPVIFQSRRETVRQFLRAFVDAEGYSHIGRSYIEFITASEQLGRELQILLLQFGVLCSRHAKKIKGYEHTYWRITITGEDARTYRDTIGFVSHRKQAALELTSDARNDNFDVVPHLAPAVGALFDEALKRSGLTVSRVREQQGNSFDNTVCHVRRGRRNPTYPFLRKLLAWSADYGCRDHHSFRTIAAVVDRNLFYDPIKKIQESEAVVMDIEVNDPSHCFVGNGFINHNTITAAAMMQKLMRDGMVEEGASYTDDKGKNVETNGRFLYVCPTSLRGNLPKEIRSFIRGDQSDLLDRVDVLSYREFSGSSKSKKVPKTIWGVKFWKGKKWDPKLYVAIFFDEAHKLKNIDSARSQAALKLWHPRKICLTASPMEKNPMEAYVLAAVSNNTPLFGKTGAPKENRKDMRRFKERFCESIGGRIIGVQQDPIVKRDMQTWVKRNVFYGDKQDVEEFQLPKLTKDPVAVEMDPDVEKAYRGITDQFSRVMGGLVAKFRDRGLNEQGPNARAPDLERVFGLAFRPIVKLMNALANRPADALQDIAHIIETRTMPWKDKEGNYPPAPRLLSRVITRWEAQFNAEELRAKANVVSNPKLNTAAETIKLKRERVDADVQGGGRSLLFTDDKKLCMDSGMHMAKTVAGLHAVALNDRLYLIGSSGVLNEITFKIDPDILERLVKDPAQRAAILKKTGGVSRILLPLKRRGRLRRYPMLPAHKQLNTHYKADNWQEFAFKEIVNPNPRVVTCTLYGPSYQYGHNLQAFDTVIHLDRDHWNSESMKQRTARAWRQGQDQPVDEITLDATYPATDDGVPRDDFDRTLDEIRAYFQQMEGEIFDQIIKNAQGIELGKEWMEMAKRDSSLVQLDRKAMELMMSPFVGRVDAPGA